MTPEAFSRMRGLFDAAMALPPDMRRGFVEDHLTANDPLRGELMAMLDAGDDSAFLGDGAWGGAAALLRENGRGPQLQIGRYKVLKELGRGGMGVVYLAIRDDDVFHKIVALKVIGDQGATQDDLVQRFRRERQILAGLDHPNIARILDGGDTEDGRPFYVMEYVAGVPIDEYSQQTGADMATRVRMVIEACQAVEYLHGHAIAHRDIKPQNILVAADGRVKLVDFGIAKVDTLDGLVATSSPPGQPTMMMTPGYASPEQIEGRASGKSADIYALGVVLYRLLAGRLPFVDEEGRPSVAAQLSGGNPVPPSYEWKDPGGGAPPRTGSSRTDTRGVSRLDLDRVVLTALRRDPLQRYTSVQAFAEDLRRCLDGRPIAARPESVTYRFRKLVFRNRIASTLAALLVAAMTLTSWFAVQSRIDQARIAAKETEVERFIAMLSAKVERWPTGVISAAEKVADLKAANRLMTSETMKSLSKEAPNPARVKRLVSNLRGVIDRADTLSRTDTASQAAAASAGASAASAGAPSAASIAGDVDVRKEITLVYRVVGDFEANPSQTRVWDRSAAAESYRRAATVAASLGAADPEWAEGQVADLGRLLRALGSPFEIQLARAPAPPPVEPSPSRAPPAATPAPRAAAPVETAPVFRPPSMKELAPEDVSTREDLARRLKTAMTQATQVRENIESLRSRLTATNQTIRPDLMISMSRVDALLEEAKSALDLNDLQTADDHLGRANYELRRLWQSVGG